MDNEAIYTKVSTLDLDSEYMSMKRVENDCEIYVNPIESEYIVNNHIYRIYSHNKVAYASQRQSAQMETFIVNFIKPSITNQSSIVPNATFTKDIMKRVSKKRTNFNLIIIGEPGLGKNTFIEALVKDNINKDENGSNKKTFKTTNGNVDNDIVERLFVLMKDEQKIYLNIIQVPNFGNELNNENLLLNILSYVNQSFEESFKFECSLDRSSIEDRKIHCCLYFISPFGHSLNPLDIAFLKQFQSKMNIIPIIGRCDTFTINELQRFKDNVLKDFQKYGINLFEYLDNSEPIEEEVDDIKDICEEIKNNIPFAVCTSMNMIQERNKNIESCREYPWGIVKTTSPEISDFRRLEAIFTKSHINYFKKLTKTVYYENFRMKYILDRVNDISFYQ